MRKPIFGVIVVVVLMAVFWLGMKAQEHRGQHHLTANDLAEALAIHWWIVKLPPNLGPKDMVGVELVSSDGKRLAGGGGFSGGKIGPEIKIYCWEDEAANVAKVAINTLGQGSGTMMVTNYFKNAAVGGASNGTVLNVGDNLLIFDQSTTPSFNGTMQNGQVGLRVAITKRP